MVLGKARPNSSHKGTALHARGDRRAGLRSHAELLDVQGVAGNKNGEFEVEAQFLCKIHTNNG
jgi:hypothetical protein